MKCDRVVVVLALALAVVAVVVHRGDERHIRRLITSADSLSRSIRDSNAVYTRQRAADDSTRHNQMGVIRGLRARLAHAQSRTDTVLDTLVLAGDTAGVRRLIDGERAQARELIDTLTAQRDWALGRMVYWRDTALAGTQQALAVQRDLLRRALAAKRPSNFWRGVAVGGALVAGYVALR